MNERTKAVFAVVVLATSTCAHVAVEPSAPLLSATLSQIQKGAVEVPTSSQPFAAMRTPLKFSGPGWAAIFDDTGVFEPSPLEWTRLEWVVDSQNRLVAVAAVPLVKGEEGFTNWHQHAQARKLDLTATGFGGILERRTANVLDAVQWNQKADFQSFELEWRRFEFLNATKDPHVFFANDDLHVTLLVRTFDAVDPARRFPDDKTEPDEQSFLAMLSPAKANEMLAAARSRMSLDCDRDRVFHSGNSPYNSELLEAVYSTRSDCFQQRLDQWNEEDGADKLRATAREKVALAEAEGRAAAAQEAGRKAVEAFLAAVTNLRQAPTPREKMAAYFALERPLEAARKGGWSASNDEVAAFDAAVAELKKSLLAELRRARRDERDATAAYYAQAVRGLVDPRGTLTLAAALVDAQDEVEQARSDLALLVPQARPGVGIDPSERWLMEDLLRDLEQNTALSQDSGLIWGDPADWLHATIDSGGEGVAVELTRARPTLTQSISVEFRESKFDGLDLNTPWGEYSTERSRQQFIKDWAYYQIATIKASKRGTDAARAEAVSTAESQLAGANDKLNGLGEAPPFARERKRNQTWRYPVMKQVWSGVMEWKMVARGAVTLDLTASWTPPTGEFIAHDPEHNVAGKRTVLLGDSGFAVIEGELKNQLLGPLRKAIDAFVRAALDSHVAAAGKKWSKADRELERKLLGHFIEARVPASDCPLGLPLNRMPSLVLR